MQQIKKNAILVVFLLIILSLAGCTQQNFPLSGTEVREYQGHKLSSIYDIRENTIKGTQYINNETYRLRITGLVQTPKNFTYQEIITNFPHYKKVATLNCVEGWSVVIL